MREVEVTGTGSEVIEVEVTETAIVKVTGTGSEVIEIEGIETAIKEVIERD